jgi:serine phosphatase RsbU (regulator of sigma subunit)
VVENSQRNLKIFAEPSAPAPTGRSAAELIASLPDLNRAMVEATGWNLRHAAGPVERAERGTSPPESGDCLRSIEVSLSAPANPGVGDPPGRLLLERRDVEVGAVEFPLDDAVMRSFGSALGGLIDELIDTRAALRQREAELAAGVPVVPHSDEEGHLARRLEAVLRGGADAVGCQAAGLYLLDEATTQLKLRSAWGLPFDRLTAPARPLQGATADLEAMLGHAVVLDDSMIMRHWNPPEDFPAAVCVPVASPTTVLGTLWVFADQRRDFSDRDTNMLEVVAGRIAADLEREMMRQQGSDSALLKRQLAAAGRLQRSQLPAISPLLDGWELAGWNDQAHGVGGDFYDWFCLPGGLLAVATGNAMDQGLDAALAASALKAALRAHGQYHREAQRALGQLNLTLWTASAGDQYASLFYGLIETATGRVSFANAGTPGALVMNENGWHPLGDFQPRLGEGPETRYEASGYELRPGETLVLFSEGLAATLDGEGQPLGPAGIAHLLAPRLDLPADALISLARQQLEPLSPEGDPRDRTLLVVKRTDP